MIVVSFCPESSMVGTRVVVRFCEKLAGARPIDAFSDGRCSDAAAAPPPPMEWPMTAVRVASTRSRTELRCVR